MITITTKNRCIQTTETEEQYEQTRQIIRRYWLKMTEETISPLLIVDNGKGTSYSIKLEGEVYLKLGEKFCQCCGKRIPRESNEEVCLECYNKETYKRRRCIFEGPGEPFGEKCSKENPPCGNRENLLRCYGEHLLYIGRFGTILKVGITSKKRYEGKYYRLIEQGLDEAIILKGIPSLEEALTIEKNISETFEIQTAIRFMEKINEIKKTARKRTTRKEKEEDEKNKEKEEEELQQNWHIWAEKLQGLYPEKEIAYIDLRGIWKKWEEKSNLRRVFAPLELAGEVVFVKGNVLIIKKEKKDEEYHAINLSQLRGFEIIPEDECLWTINE